MFGNRETNDKDEMHPPSAESIPRLLIVYPRKRFFAEFNG